jgi:hypothetical protein
VNELTVKPKGLLLGSTPASTATTQEMEQLARLKNATQQRFVFVNEVNLPLVDPLSDHR